MLLNERGEPSQTPICGIFSWNVLFLKEDSKACQTVVLVFRAYVTKYSIQKWNKIFETYEQSRRFMIRKNEELSEYFALHDVS